MIQGYPQHTLKLTRIIAASQKEVFEAWTTADSMKQWFCPQDATVLLIELDVRIDGLFRIEIQHPDEGRIAITGVYREIVPPEKLVFTWLSRHTHHRESLVTLEFLARGEATELILVQTQLPDEEAVQRHIAAWTQILDCLATSFGNR